MDERRHYTTTTSLLLSVPERQDSQVPIECKQCQTGQPSSLQPPAFSFSLSLFSLSPLSTLLSSLDYSSDVDYKQYGFHSHYILYDLTASPRSVANLFFSNMKRLFNANGPALS